MKNIIYAHEHITTDLSSQKNDMDCRLDDRGAAVRELGSLARLGVEAVIDQTNMGMGRNPSYAESVAAAAGLRVVHATGYYKEPFLPSECHVLGVAELSDIMVGELQDGIGDSGIKAGFIGEIGTSANSIHPVEEKIFRAAARAHIETGVPICTHTTLGSMGMEQIAIFRQVGVDLSKVVLSHIDLSADMDYMQGLLDTGVNIAFDTVGKLSYRADTDRAAWLSELCGRGYAGQIVMSVDITRKSHYKENGGIGYAYLLETFVPMAESAGCTDAQLRQMLTENPARIYLDLAPVEIEKVIS